MTTCISDGVEGVEVVEQKNISLVTLHIGSANNFRIIAFPESQVEDIKNLLRDSQDSLALNLNTAWLQNPLREGCWQCYAKVLQESLLLTIYCNHPKHQEFISGMFKNQSLNHIQQRIRMIPAAASFSARQKTLRDVVTELVSMPR